MEILIRCAEHHPYNGYGGCGGAVPEDSLHHRDGILITRISRNTAGARYCITQSEPREQSE